MAKSGIVIIIIKRRIMIAPATPTKWRFLFNLSFEVLEPKYSENMKYVYLIQ